jgi:hypothetical protein
MKIILKDTTLNRAGQRIVAIIKQRTLEGIDKDGNPFKPYSTRPFAMPAGAMTQRTRKSLYKDGKIQYFKRNGKLWVVVKDGYAGFKKVNNNKTAYDGTVNLSATGDMMRGITVLSASNNTITIGTTRTEAAKKLMWNIDKGRNPLGITASDLNDPVLIKILAEGVIIQF